MATKKFSLEYIAGIVDGEGCISIHVNRARAARFANQQPRVVMQLAVSNCYKPLIDALHQQFGGTINRHQDYHNPNARPNWRWCLSEQAACKLVSKLFPYLFIKAKQAALLLMLGKMKALNGRHRLSNAQVKERLRIAKMCSRLNRRGR